MRKPSTDFRPLRPLKEFGAINPKAFDPTVYTFIPDRAVDNSKVLSVSPRKFDLIGAKTYRSTTQSINSAATTAITFDTMVYVAGIISPTGTWTTLTIPYDGIYILTGNVQWDAGLTLGHNIWFTINGTLTEGSGDSNDADTFASKMSLMAQRRMTAGDTLGLSVRQGSGGAVSTSAGEDNCSLAFTYLGSI